MKTKTVYKVISWRFVSVCVTYFITYMMTGNITEATGFTLLLHTVLLITNYIFETLWERHVSKKHRDLQ